MAAKILVITIAYLLGAIPFGYIIVRIRQGSDIRNLGSGNIGATNVFRSSSKLGGILTLLLDAGKGYFAVVLARSLVSDPTRTWEVMAAVVAIFGHLFPVFLKFKGGKGVAVGCGAYLAVSPVAVAFTLLIFVLTAGISRYISLASIIATATYPLWAYLYHEPRNVVIGGIVGATLIVAKHHSNIRRLLRGSEHKFAVSEKSS
jgi:glycerol-3-phosphate acyltransferase PlsY